MLRMVYEVVLTENLKEDSGYQWVVTKLNPHTPFGRSLAINPYWYKPDEKNLLEMEFRNIEVAREQLKNRNKEYHMLLNSLRSFRDIRGSFNRQDFVPMDEVELYEVKYFLLIFDKMLDYYKKIDCFENIEFIQMQEILKILDPTDRRLPIFSVEDIFDEKLEKIRKEKIDIEKEITKADSDERSVLLEKRRRVALYEDEIELNVREKLTKKIMEYKSVIFANMKEIGRLDFMLIKAQFALRYGCTKPIISEEKKINAVEVLHPQVIENLGKKKFTAVTLELESGSTVITGANMGGKSIALKTVTLQVLLMHTGFFVFADKFECSMFDYVSLLLADNQSIERGLSSFGSEIMSINELFENAKDKTFFLALDEFARGTNPEEGAILAGSLAQYLSSLSCISLMTTHYDGVSQMANAHYQVLGLKDDIQLLNSDESAPLEHLSSMMDYRLKKVSKNAKCPQDALKVCKLLNLNETILNIFVKRY